MTDVLWAETQGFAFETKTVDATAGGVALTTATFAPTSAVAAARAFITCEGANMRFCYDGTAPTATAGHHLDVGDTVEIVGLQNIAAFRAIRTGPTSGTLYVTYER